MSPVRLCRLDAPADLRERLWRLHAECCVNKTGFIALAMALCLSYEVKAAGLDSS